MFSTTDPLYYVYFVFSHDTGTFIDAVSSKIKDFNAAGLGLRMKLLFYPDITITIQNLIIWKQKSSQSSNTTSDFFVNNGNIPSFM